MLCHHYHLYGRCIAIVFSHRLISIMITDIVVVADVAVVIIIAVAAVVSKSHSDEN